MPRSRNYLFSMVAASTLWGSAAQADRGSAAQADQALPPPPAPPAAGAVDPVASHEPAAPAPATPGAPAAPDAEVTDAALANLVTGAEEIEIFDERPDKPFDRDTELRLTGAELAARGVVDLATALALLSDVTVRDAGRGGFNIDIRGARKGAVSVLIDGVLVSDPYYGTFDASTIPVTDIVQIRVATTPQSPIDGPGGPGGVIEVHTRDAVGTQLVVARLTADSLPSLGGSGTARVALGKRLALRLSASGLGGARDFSVPNSAPIGEDRHAATGAGRLEYRDGRRRIAIDGFLDDRHYVAPPSDVTRSTILLIDRETSARASIKADDQLGQVQVQAQAFTHYLNRRTRFFSDPALSNQAQVENLAALRTGGTALATMPFARDFRWAASASVDFEKAVVSNILNDAVRGQATVVEVAADLQYERGRLRADLAGGIALPFGVPARAWPEGKAVVKYRPLDDLELTATAAFKGRVPSLRERFDANFGNPALGPERIAHGELRAVEHVAGLLHLELAPYYKRSTGTVRTSVNPMDQGRLVNLGTVTFFGVDAMARVTPHPMLEAGGGYAYVKASAEETGDDPLDRLPRHRWDGWVQARPDARFSALARVKYFGAANDQAMRVDGYALVEANLTAQLTKQYLAVVRVDDLLNARPETRASYHAAGRVISLVMQGTWE
jgi:hypothetical protein